MSGLMIPIGVAASALEGLVQQAILSAQQKQAALDAMIAAMKPPAPAIDEPYFADRDELLGPDTDPPKTAA